MASSGGDARARERELAEFLTSLSGYAPTIPDVVTRYQLSKSGVKCRAEGEEEHAAEEGEMDDRVVRLVALATDKFVADIINDARRNRDLRLRHAKAVTPQGGTAETPGGEDIALSAADVVASLKERGVEVVLPPASKVS
jgi:transcription initiation factor TFIID subunit 10